MSKYDEPVTDYEEDASSGVEAGTLSLKHSKKRSR